MAVLGLDEILQRITADKLIENLGTRDLHTPEGCGIDLRIGKALRIIEGGAFIEADGPAGQGLRKGVKTEEIASFAQDSDTQVDFSILPGEYLLIQTVETLTIPEDLVVRLVPRSSLHRSGVGFFCGKGDPGYSGQLTVGIQNMSAFPVRFQAGARFCNAVFEQVSGSTVTYRGQHQGGRITAEEIEKQV
jgi:deoxycytidine triphosphate deaminase